MIPLKIKALEASAGDFFRRIVTLRCMMGTGQIIPDDPRISEIVVSVEEIKSRLDTLSGVMGNLLSIQMDEYQARMKR